jgi:hypothetical protein
MAQKLRVGAKIAHSNFGDIKPTERWCFSVFDMQLPPMHVICTCAFADAYGWVWGC